MSHILGASAYYFIDYLNTETVLIEHDSPENAEGPSEERVNRVRNLQHNKLPGFYLRCDFGLLQDHAPAVFGHSFIDDKT
jgi:hypothetical protein